MTCEKPEKPNGNGRIHSGTLVPIGAAAVVLIAILQFHSWLNSEINDIKTELRLIRRDMQSTWTIGQMSSWSYQLRDKNPTLTVPDPAQVAKQN